MSRPSTWCRFVAAIAWGCVGVGSARADAILYQQGPQFPGAFGGTWTSDYGFDPAVPGNRGFWTFDNFTLPQTGTVNQVRFQGMYWDYVVPGNNPVNPDTTSWELAFWQNSPSGFFPGPQLSVQTLPAAAVSREFQGFASFPSLPNVPLPVYNFTANLPQAFTAQGGTTYWLSILGMSPTFNPVWLWMPGNGPDNTSIQYVLGANRVITGGQYVGNDRAFALVTSVPEPATACVLLVGGVGLLVRRRVTRRGGAA